MHKSRRSLVAFVATVSLAAGTAELLLAASGMRPGPDGMRRWAITRQFNQKPQTQAATPVDQQSPATGADDLAPRHRQYKALQDALAHYRDIAQHGGWSPVAADLRLKPGQQAAGVPSLAHRLAITGDYTGAIDNSSLTYGVDLQEAVKRFQRRHGLEPDAVVGAALVTQLNVPVEQRIEQLAFNLDRWRALPADLGPRYILVNIPEYRLEVWDGDAAPLTMRVVVGKRDTPTPTLTAEMNSLVFDPYWNVPSDIVKKETLPHALRDPAFLEKTNIDVLDRDGHPVEAGAVDLENAGAYRFRQRPGVANALGLVKFVFPNPYDVYLHDTPSRGAFRRAFRALSHGCVRIAEPEQLATYLLGDQPAWTRERIEEAMHAGHERSVRLAGPVPVYIGYWTARVSADGLVQFRDDLYGMDRREMAARGSGQPAPTPGRPTTR